MNIHMQLDEFSLPPMYVAYRVLLLVCLSLFYELVVNRFIYLFLLIHNCV